MGNRGILHDETGRLGRVRWRHRHWIICKLEFKNRHRVVFAPGHYSELFALDEATFLAAGHRPCAECRREAFNHFVACWKMAHGVARDTFVSAQEIDQTLHQARVQDGRQVTYQARLGELPDGVFVTLLESPTQPRIIWDGHLRSWSHHGYVEPAKIRPDVIATVLTPLPIVRTVAAGYVPKTAIVCSD